MANEPKVLTGLLERRAIEAAFEELSKTSDPDLRMERAQAIADRGEAALHALVALLDTPDAALRGRLGLVATLLPRESVVPALQTVAHSPERTDQARVAAASLLERYLGEHADPGQFAPLTDPDAAALQSLRELVFAMDQEPLAILEFMQQLAEQPAQVAEMLVDATSGAPDSPHVATFLRVLAYGEDRELARRALDQLARMRSPFAAHALTVLSRVLPPAEAAIAERGIRKLRFSGVPLDETDALGPLTGAGLDWRVLLTPVDPEGTQFAWFVGERTQGDAVFLTLLLNDPDGILSAAIALGMAPDRVPRRGPVGSLLNVDGGDGGAPVVVLLEAPLEEGVAVVRSALARHWDAGVVPPLAFRVLAPFIFGGEAPEPFEAPAERHDAACDDIADLAESPLGLAWFAREREALARGTAAEEVFAPAVRASYTRRLRTMARWLKMAGEADGAAQAEILAEHLAAAPTHESVFIQRLSELARAAARQTKE